MTNPSSQLIIIGKFGKTYGVQGWLKIHSFMEEAGDILNFKDWLVGDEPNWQAYQLEDGRIQGNAIVAKLAGIDAPESARLITGKKIAIYRSQLPALPENEYYWSDLEGLTVINQHGQILGTVSYLLSTGSNDVMVVKGDKDYAIPYLLGSVIKKVDLVQQQIYVDWEPL